MKHNTTSKSFPSHEQRAAALAAAPDQVPDSDCPYNPNDAKAVDAFWKNAVISHSLPELREKLAARRRGAQKTATKIPTTIRFDADVLAELKASGRGWQTRVNEAVREWLKAHSQDELKT